MIKSRPNRALAIALAMLSIVFQAMAQDTPPDFFDEDDLQLLKVETKADEGKAPGEERNEASGHNHMAGLTVGVGPLLKTGFDFMLTTTAEYRYVLLNGHLGVGAQIGFAHYGSRWVSLTSFLGYASAEYYVLTGKWRPYGGIQMGGMAGDIDAFVLSPAVGCMYGLSERVALDAGLRFPIAFVRGGNQPGMTINIGGHFKF